MTRQGNRIAIAVVAVVTLLLIGLPLQRTGSAGAVLSFLVPTLATMAIFAVICIGLNIQWGYTGIFNFGVAAFFMIGAYTAAIVTKGPADGEFATYIGGFGAALSAVPLPGASQWLPFFVAVVAASLVSALLALLLGWPTVRLREDYLAITLIGAAEVLRRIATEERWLVNGSRGLGGIPRPFAGVVDPDTYRYLFLLLTVILVVTAYVLADRGIRSPWGRVLRAIREDEEATAAAGKSVIVFKLQGFVLGAAIMGAGGAFFAFQQGAISPDTFTHFFGTFILWAMLIAGGSGNMVGAIVGVYVIWGLWSTTLQLQGYELPAFVAGRIPHLRDTLIGLTIVAVLLLNPGGLLPEQARVSGGDAAKRNRTRVSAPYGRGDYSLRACGRKWWQGGRVLGESFVLPPCHPDTLGSLLAEVGLSHHVVAEELTTGAGEDDVAGLDHVASVGHR